VICATCCFPDKGTIWNNSWHITAWFLYTVLLFTHRGLMVSRLFYLFIFFFKETPTGALYYTNLVIYTNKPFVSNLICYCLNLQITYSITITLGLVVLVTI